MSSSINKNKLADMCNRTQRLSYIEQNQEKFEAMIDFHIMIVGAMRYCVELDKHPDPQAWSIFKSFMGDSWTIDKFESIGWSYLELEL